MASQIKKSWLQGLVWSLNVIVPYLIIRWSVFILFPPQPHCANVHNHWKSRKVVKCKVLQKLLFWKFKHEICSIIVREKSLNRFSN